MSIDAPPKRRTESACLVERFAVQHIRVFAFFALLIAACSSSGSNAVPATTPPTSESSTTLPDTNDTINALADVSQVVGELVMRTETGRLIVTDAAGTERTELAGPDDAHSQPTWSLDNGQIAWSSVGESGGAISIWNSATGATEQIEVDIAPFYYSWSAENVLASLGPGPAGLELGLIEDGQYEPVGVGQPFYFDWDPPGDSLTAAMGGQQLSRLTIEGREVDILDPGADLAIFQSPTVLSDGGVVVAVQASEGGVDPTDFSLVILDSDGATRTIARGNGFVSVSANPHSQTLAVLVSPNGEPDNDVQLVSLQAVSEVAPGQVSILDLESGAVDRLPERNVVAMTWSPDGEWLAALSTVANGLRWSFEGEGRRIDGPTFVPSSEYLNSYLPFYDQYNQSVSWWSPDSEAFVFAGTVGGDSGIWVDVIDDSAEPVLVGAGDIALWSR